MKKLIFGILTILMISCKDIQTGPEAGKNEIELGKAFGFEGENLQVIVIDSCEYLHGRLGHDNGLLTHKGNCKNTFHSRQ